MGTHEAFVGQLPEHRLVARLDRLAADATSGFDRGAHEAIFSSRLGITFCSTLMLPPGTHSRAGRENGECVMPESLSLKIRKRLTDAMPFAYCDSCLALRLGESLEDARAAAMLVAREDGFMRKVRACYECQRSVEMTEVTR